MTEPYFSETVELMGVIWRLAGSQKYSECQVVTVANSVYTYFASMKNHQAVTLANDYVDLGIETNNGKKLYFATMNVGETSPGGVETFYYRWGTTEANGSEWKPPYNGWPVGKRLDAAHDIATITWGEKWHTPSPEEWNLLVENCDYERKEADESGYGVAGYFFYNRSDRSKFIFLPVTTWSDELAYWSSEISEPYNGNICAYNFQSSNGYLSCWGKAGIKSTGFAVRPVFVE